MFIFQGMLSSTFSLLLYRIPLHPRSGKGPVCSEGPCSRNQRAALNCLIWRSDPPSPSTESSHQQSAGRKPDLHYKTNPAGDLLTAQLSLAQFHLPRLCVRQPAAFSRCTWDRSHVLRP
ncbi:phosphatidylglycerophosphatase and protein-tyrosine phosphatase 1 [Platysternon megacephalum]|uniref:Phosphatidylglycerophosphatase and protein-tyrosine phosphatase 1 n=1 Tax=Platysternon megacephalum TaxID=55544 RepID=A0A4D9EGX2_9SAUR|nr:phosphatidylglycerophosphatase and protein-tyrosine phosphatase 1 [Platysternon megacephalum]